jgi:hypothetical protein
MRTLLRVLAVLGTFHFVCFCWVFFRAGSFQQAWLMLSQLAELSFHRSNLHTPLLLVLGIGLVSHYMPTSTFERIKRAFIAAPAIVQGVVLFLAALGVRQMVSSEAVPFVYFQF